MKRKPSRRSASAAARAFRDAVRDIVEDQGWFEVLVDTEARERLERRGWMLALSPTATA